MGDVKTLDECMDLYTLLTNYEVRIPIIQRDYAQGRDSEEATTVRKRLIADFIKALDTGGDAIDFNFIYGIKDACVFYPVDGQQRLTSLYLLLWVLAARSSDPSHMQEFCELKEFSYATRNSSAEFFALLRKNEPELLTLIKGGEDIKKEIVNYPWFSAEWNNDPTVTSSISFLNGLRKALKDKNCDDMYIRLTDQDYPAVYFTVHDETGGGGEISAAVRYIRMNARGRELTMFENVKAMLDSIGIAVGNKITSTYDRTFIDVFYRLACADTLEAKTEDIDKKSICFFMNLYNVVSTVCGKMETAESENAYMELMYAYALDLSGAKDFFVYYFDMAVRVLSACNEYPEIAGLIKNIFSKEFSLVNDSEEISIILYLYYLNKPQDALGKLNMLIYVLKNLAYRDWGSIKNGYAQINKLIKEIAKYSDVSAFFRSDNYKNIFLPDDIAAISINDIETRLKEQHIKALIIDAKKWSFNTFDNLETQSVRRKIQYLLWVSDMWDNHVSESGIVMLEQYIDIAKMYFMTGGVKWLKRFAITGCCDDDGVLYDSGDINGINWKERCQWNDEYYFWGDGEPGPNALKLGILKRAYNRNDEDYATYAQILEDHTYEACWLRYAVSRNRSELLTNEITGDKNTGKVYIRDGADSVSFMTRVLLYDKGVTSSYTSTINLLNESSFRDCCGGFGFGKFSMRHCSTITLHSNKAYAFSDAAKARHSKDNQYFSDHYGSSNYNMYMYTTAGINFNFSDIDESDVAYLYDYKQQKYQLFINIPGTNKFRVFSYDIQPVIAQFNACIKYTEAQINDLRNEMSISQYDNILYLYNKKPTNAYNGWRHSSYKDWVHYTKISAGLPNMTETVLV